MYQINFEQPIHIHFIGIGGISMSGLAELLLSRHFSVSGSDIHASDLTRRLESLGAVIYEGQSAENITEDIDAVVYTAAVHEDNPEFARAVSLEIPLLSRAQLLGQLMRNYHTAVAVAGTHGKTTTTSMLAQIMLAANKDPTVSVGGILPSIGGNMRIGHSDCFVTEACEYTDSFLEFFPTLAVILNIREDHLDFFKDITDIRKSFHAFASLVPADGTVVIDTGIDNFEEIAEDLDCSIVTVGPDPRSDYRAEEVICDAAGSSFTVVTSAGERMKLSLQIPGRHNVENALSAVAAARQLDISWDKIQSGLAGFQGAERRFQKKGEFHGVTVIDDYAHHPDEIRATLTAASRMGYSRIWCVFQPHTYSRTKALFEEFAQALCLADEAVLTDIYAAREAYDPEVSSEMLARRMSELGASVHYFPTFEKIEKFLLEHCSPGELLITMGAGDIVKVGDELVTG